MLYLARDKSGLLGCYSAKPTKGEKAWYAGIMNLVGFIENDELKNIKWEDEEPLELDLKIVATKQTDDCDMKEIEREVKHLILQFL